MPFEVPKSWEWCKVEDFSFGLQYGTSEKSLHEGLVPVLRMGNITCHGTIDYSDLVYSSNEDDIDKYSLQYNDLLFNRTNSSEWVGKTAIYKAEKPALYAGYLIRIRTFVVYPDFINFVMNSSYHRDWCNQVKTDAVNQSNINAQKLSKLQIPLPPLSEQERIVAEIDRWFALIDELEKDKNDLQDAIKQTKNKILDLAIHGKLVEQDPNDKPASELLKRIAPNAMPCDTSHYGQLPQNWCVCKVGDIADVISGVSYNKTDIQQNGLKILRGGNVQDGKIIEQEDDVYISETYVNEVNRVKQGDIVMVASTGSQTLIGKTGFATEDYTNTQIGAFLRIIRSKDTSLCEYLNCIIMSESFRKHIRLLASGTNINNVKNKYITDFSLGLPPINEIVRIIEMIKRINKVIDNIATEL